MLNVYEFKVLRALERGKYTSQRQLAQAAGVSLGTANKALKSLEQAKLVKNAALTAAGKKELEAYRVHRAVILAAGAGGRLAPLSYERPKAMFEVNGEILIERLIRQLNEAGIDDITVVVGYRKDEFFYLGQKFGVKLVVNAEYAETNSTHSLYLAREALVNAYVCASDQYFPENPFASFEFAPYLSVTPLAGPTTEQVLAASAKGRLTKIADSARGGLFPQGPAYFDAQAATTLAGILEREVSVPETRDRHWENIVTAHLSDLALDAKENAEGALFEFNDVNDLCQFDADFMRNVDSDILDNICATLDCTRDEITDVETAKAGLTNLSVLFSVRGVKYVYRHPGPGTNAIINREAETFSLNVAKRLGLDETFVFEDPQEGWKISRFIEGCIPFDYRNDAHVARALQIGRTLHESGEVSPWSFDNWDEAVNIIGILKDAEYPLPSDFEELFATIEELAQYVKAESGRPVLCHNDFYGPNFLVRGDEMQLIDWEYSAMGDYASDIGNFIAQGSGYTVEESIACLDKYFGRTPTAAEVRHCMAMTALVGYYWYVWAIFKGMQGNPVGEWLYLWYQSARQFSAYALPLYREDPAAQRANAPEPLTRAEFDELVAKEAAGTATAGELARLEPYRAKRAVFMAAGFGSRMLPITINTPKPLVRVHGTRIIDRLIDAVRAVGVAEIYVVRGYLAESFNQLLDKYPEIRFIENPLFAETNNISSAVAAAKHFECAYVFESDLYLTDTSYITKYQYQSNYLGIPVDSTEDWYFDATDDGTICHIAKGKDAPCWKMVGLSYWTAEDGARLAEDIPAEFEREDAKQIFWDDVALDRRPDNYRVAVRPCAEADVVEIDSFAELQEIDPAYRPKDHAEKRWVAGAAE